VPGRSAKATYRRMERLRERAEVAECEARGLSLPWVVMFPRAMVYEYTVLRVAQEIREGRWRAGSQQKGMQPSGGGVSASRKILADQSFFMSSRG
jgi:hypothetical protein